MGAFSALASEMPRVMAAMLATASMVYGIWLARREARRIPRMLVWPVDGPPHLDGLELRDVCLRWRGPLAFLQCRNVDGRMERLSWWSDTLAAHERRELTLAAAGTNGVRQPTSMAP